MRVECANCGNYVDVNHVPAPCPRCGATIADATPRVLVYRPGGFRLEKPPADPVMDASGQPSSVPGGVTPNPYPIHRDPPPRAARTVQVIIVAGVCLVLAFIVVDYIRLKSRSMISTAASPPTGSTSPDSSAPATPPASAPPVSGTPPAVAGTGTDTGRTVAGSGGRRVDDSPARGCGHCNTAGGFFECFRCPPRPAAEAVATTAQGHEKLHPVHSPRVEGELTDADINEAIQRGVSYVISQFNDQGQLEDSTTSKELAPGRHALATLALLHAGMATTDERLSLSGPFMTRLIEQLKSYEFDTPRNDTYSRSLRLMALGMPNRQEDRPVMSKDLDYLMKAVGEVAYTYSNPDNHQPGAPVPWDNSNSQYGALGAWAGSDAGMHVPTSYWRGARPLAEVSIRLRGVGLQRTRRQPDDVVGGRCDALRRSRHVDH